MKDYRFHCKDCDSFNQCQYYHNRKGTSFICKEFQYGVIEQIRAEIKQTAQDYDKFADYRRIRGLWIALDIIDKYKAESEGEHG